MASLSNVYISIDNAKKLLHEIEKSGQKGIGLTVAIDDKVNVFRPKLDMEIRNNVSIYLKQSKEEIDNKEKKNYLMNGATFWSNGSQKIAKELPERG